MGQLNSGFDACEESGSCVGVYEALAFAEYTSTRLKFLEDQELARAHREDISWYSRRLQQGLNADIDASVLQDRGQALIDRVERAERLMILGVLL